MTLILDTAAVRLFGACYLVLVIKMLAMSVYVGAIRVRRKVFRTPEDYRLAGLEPARTVDEDIERWRRAHQNDLEIILPFFGLGLLYALTNPSFPVAQLALVGFTVARLAHTVFYVRALQPHRSIAQVVAYVTMVWMILATGWSLTCAR